MAGAVADQHDTALARAAFEVANARANLVEAVRRAAADGLTQRTIAGAIGSNQAAVHRMLRQTPLPETSARYDRPEARFHLELHREIGRHVVAGSVDMSRARCNVTRMRAQGSDIHQWLDDWDRILALPAPAMVDAFLIGGAHGDDLRQVSPLLGEVTDVERAAALQRAYRS